MGERNINYYDLDLVRFCVRNGDSIWQVLRTKEFEQEKNKRRKERGQITV